MQLINGQCLMVKVHKCTPPASPSHDVLKVCGSCHSIMIRQDVICSLQNHMQRSYSEIGPHKHFSHQHHLKCYWPGTLCFVQLQDFLQLQVHIKLPKLFVLRIWGPSHHAHCPRPALDSSVLADLCSHPSCFDPQRGAQPLMQRRLQLLLILYVYDAKKETFLPVPDMPLGLSLQLSAVIQHLHQINSGEYRAMSQDLHHSCCCS